MIFILLLSTMLQSSDACTTSQVTYTYTSAKQMCRETFGGFLLSLKTDDDVDRLCEKMENYNQTAMWIGLEYDCKWQFQNPDDTCPNTNSAFRCINEDWWLYRYKNTTRYRPRCKTEGGYNVAYFDKIRGGVDNNISPDTQLPCACCQRGTCRERQCRYRQNFITLSGQWTINSYEIWRCDANGKYTSCCSSNNAVTVSMDDYDSPRAYTQDVCKDDCDCE